jgi:hypothetical protein
MQRGATVKRLLAALTALLLAGAAVLLLTSGSGSTSVASGPTALETATLATIAAPAQPARPAPDPKFTRTIYATSTLARSELMLDFCRGPIAVDLGHDRPVLVAEHDFCGGSAWMPRLGEGDAVKLSGDGVEDGTYVVSTIEHAVRGQAKVRDLPDTDIVLQTCVTPKQMVLVGLDRFDPAVRS